jgi:hypothetical protein
MVQHTIHARAVSRLSLDYKVCRDMTVFANQYHLCISTAASWLQRREEPSTEPPAQSTAPKSGSRACCLNQTLPPYGTQYSYYYHYTGFLPKEAGCVCRQAAVMAAKILPLVGLARFKQDPINRGHGAQYLYRPSPDGATTNLNQNSASCKHLMLTLC